MYCQISLEIPQPTKNGRLLASRFGLEHGQLARRRVVFFAARDRSPNTFYFGPLRQRWRKRLGNHGRELGARLQTGNLVLRLIDNNFRAVVSQIFMRPYKNFRGFLCESASIICLHSFVQFILYEVR